MKLTRAIEYFITLCHRKYSTQTIAVYMSHLRQFVAFVGDKPIEEVDLFKDVMAFSTHLEKTGHRDNTVNLAMTAIRQLWKAMYSLERQLDIRLKFMSDTIPVKKLVVAHSHRPIKDLDYEALMQVISNEPLTLPFLRARDLAVFSLLYDTGLRISELTALNVSDIDLERCSAEVVTRKRVDHLKKRETYWTLETNRVLIDYLNRRKEMTNTDVLFINLQDRQRLSTRSIQRTLKIYLKAANIDPRSITPHSFRHGVGMRAVASQMYPPHLQALLGHRNANSSQVYYNIHNENVRHEYHARIGDMRPQRLVEHLKNSSDHELTAQ